MQYNISISENRKYVYVRTNGPITRKLIFEINQKIVNFPEVEAGMNFFYDMRGCKNIDTVANKYDTMYRDKINPIFRQGSRIAVLLDVGDDSHDFLLVTGKNVGLNIEFFTDFERAKKWAEEY